MPRLASFGALVCCAFASSCSPQVRLLARLVSPDGRLDAVHAQPQTGATVGLVDWVYVVPHGAKLGGKPIFIADKVSPALQVAWSGSELMISAEGARVFRSAREAKVGAAIVPIHVLVATQER